MRGTAFHTLTPCSEGVRAAEKLEHRPWGEGQDRCHSHSVVKLSLLLTLHTVMLNVKHRVLWGGV